jgi:DNA-binding NarL/FixJ family response regulator
VSDPDDGAVSDPDNGAVSGPDAGAVSGPDDGAVSGPDDGAVRDPEDGARAGAVSGAARPIRLAVVDDDPFVRAGLAMLLRGAPDIEVVAEGGDGAEAIALTDAHAPDVILMDIRMPRMDGLVATERLRGRARAPQIIVLTTFDVDDYVLRALRAGAGGFLLKDAPPRDILRAVRTVAAGEAMLSPAVARRLIDHVADPAAAARRTDARSRLARLTDREREVAAAVGRGRSNAEIAAELRMGVPTVKAHVSRLLAKLAVNNRVQIALLVHDAAS